MDKGYQGKEIAEPLGILSLTGCGEDFGLVQELRQEFFPSVRFSVSLGGEVSFLGARLVPEIDFPGLLAGPLRHLNEPFFITNFTFRNALMRRLGSPSTAIRWASIPAFTGPMSRCMRTLPSKRWAALSTSKLGGGAEAGREESPASGRACAIVTISWTRRLWQPPAARRPL